MAERRPRLGVLPAGAFDLRPGPGGVSWDFDKPEDRDRVIRITGAQGLTWWWAALRARTGAG
eukprot:7230522-Alexandrium_andersonii.AAC.1